MGFVGVCRAIYDYTPSGENELAIREGDLLFIVEKSSTDNWWKAKKKAPGEDDEEPEGLIPNNYVEEVTSLRQARALYDYSRQTDEELSFSADAVLNVYDTSEEDWTLVGLDGEYGFVPANYIEPTGTLPHSPSSATEQGNGVTPSQSPFASPVHSPAAALAGIIQQKAGPISPSASRPVPAAPQYTPEASDDEPAPSLPRRPASQQISPVVTQYATPRSLEPPGVMASPPYNRESGDQSPMSPGSFHMYNIHEMVSHLGKNKKMPTTLGINAAKGVIMIAPAKSKDGPSKEWRAEKLTHYSIEGKHVFMELVRPSKSIDFHAGAKDTAQEIVSALGELAGASRAGGLREIIAAATGGGQKTGKMLYEFMAQSNDEVTVALNDEVIVLDDVKSEEWWMVRRLKNGKEGVVPSSYVEITGTLAAARSVSGLNAGRSTVEQNRLDEERITNEAGKKHVQFNSNAQSGSAFELPDRNSSLMQRSPDARRASLGTRRNSRTGDKASTSTKARPADSKVRMWTDRSGSFRVEAEFLGLKDSKIHLHKLNGVKIAVPVAKMSTEDIEYVEQATGQSLDDEKPLSDIKRKTTQRRNDQAALSPGQSAGASIEQPQKPKYDWFEFFLSCGVNPQICQRYTSAFDRDQMGEENLQDIDTTLLRTLGLKEGDILRVTKTLDSRFGRTRGPPGTTGADITNGDSGGLFSGPGGALRNNTRKGRPAPTVQTNDSVDSGAFESAFGKAPDRPSTTLQPTPPPSQGAPFGFDDDAWDVKPSQQESRPLQPAAPTTSFRPQPTGALAELSFLSPPLQPSPAPPQSAPPQVPALQPSRISQPLQPQQTGANPSFFNQLAQPPASMQNSQGQSQQLPVSRQILQAPSQHQTQGSILPPPSTRPSMALGQQSSFGPPPLQAQITGYQMQIAPPGQSMTELNQQRLQQSFNPLQMQSQPTGFGYTQQPNGILSQQLGFNQFPQQPQQTGYGQFQQPQPTGYQPMQQQQYVNGQQNGGPFADPPRPQFQPQPSSFQQQTYSSQPLQPQQTGINSFLPPALQPQRTGGINGFGSGMSNQSGFGQQQQQQTPLPPLPQIPSIPYQPSAAPLPPQKTGPAPSIRFGVTGAAQKLVPQPTGRANLANATPQNPFGF